MLRYGMPTGHFIEVGTLGLMPWFYFLLIVFAFGAFNRAWIEKCVCEQWVSCVGIILCVGVILCG